MHSRLFPYGKSGLKSVIVRYLFAHAGLFPYGKSGLKLWGRLSANAKKKSLPVWEEWIEIVCPGQIVAGAGSLPVWEEWIEISATTGKALITISLFPYGKSGLKLLR